MLEADNFIDIQDKQGRIQCHVKKDILGDGNMELTNNLYLQESRYWEQFTKRSVIPNSNQSELYFEEPDIEHFVERLETLCPEIEYVNYLMTHSWGQKVVRFYDLDGNLIEVGTPV